VVAAAPLAVLVLLIVGHGRPPAPVVVAAPARIEPARPSPALTNEPIEVARFSARVVPIEHVVITPTVVELPPRPQSQPAPAGVRSHRRVVAASVTRDELVKAASSTPPPSSPPPRSRSFTDATSAPLRPRPIDVVNPFVLPRTAAITGAPAR
jgi:hypothetical protein